MKLKPKFILILGCLTASATFAKAYAFLDHSDPPVGSTTKAPPAVVKIWFTMEIQGARSDIKVFDVKGSEIDNKDAKVDSANKSLMTVSLPKLAVGRYKVVWNAVCPWGHHTSGTFTYNVAGP